MERIDEEGKTREGEMDKAGEGEMDKTEEAEMEGEMDKAGEGEMDKTGEAEMEGEMDKAEEGEMDKTEGAEIIERRVEEASDDEGEEDGESTEKSGEESAEGDDVSEGTEILESEEETENLSGDTLEIREEGGEVVNREKRKAEKECKSVMKKPQVKVLEEMKEVGQGTRRFSRRIVRQDASRKTGQDGEKEKTAPTEISSEEEEEESPLKRRPRGIPIDQAADAAEETVVSSPSTPTEPVTLAAAKSISTPAMTEIQATPVPEQMPEEAEQSVSKAEDKGKQVADEDVSIEEAATEARYQQERKKKERCRPNKSRRRPEK